MKGVFSRIYHSQTDFNFPLGANPSNPQYWPKEWREIYHKEYPRLPKIHLPKEFLKLGTLENCLNERRSTREFNIQESLTIKELSTLLFYSAGVKRSKAADPKLIRRHYPSGGARYPLEVYLAIQRVDSLKPGIYHYNVKDHSLEELSTNPQRLENFKEGLFYPWSREAAVVYVITAAWERNMMKYEDRGYRIALMEAGHLAQNLSLAAAALDVGCCNSVGFHNQRMNEVLHVNHGFEESSLYIALLGRYLAPLPSFLYNI